MPIAASRSPAPAWMSRSFLQLLQNEGHRLRRLWQRFCRRGIRGRGLGRRSGGRRGLLGRLWHRDLHSVDGGSRRTTEAPPRRYRRRGGIPTCPRQPGTAFTTAPIADQCQSFLDNLRAHYPIARSWNDRAWGRLSRATRQVHNLKVVSSNPTPRNQLNN